MSIRQQMGHGAAAILLLVSGPAQTFAQTAGGPPTPVITAPATSPTVAIPVRTDYEACLARDDAGFKAAIQAVTIATLERAIKGLDYRPIVAEEWRQGDIDAILDRQVGKTLEEIRQETSWSELITSLASRATQEKLATAAAERVYHAEPMRTAFETLAEGVSRQIGNRLELATGEASEEATRCLRDNLGPRFGRMVALAVAKDAGEKLTIDANQAKASVSKGQILVEGKEGIAGLVMVILRRQLGNLARRVGQRLVGAVLGRVVSAVAGGIGLALIAKDIWELRNGVLPIIATEMKSNDTRDKVQAELAKTISTEVDNHLHEIGERTADAVIGAWDKFRQAHAKVLEIAERVPRFKQFINSVSPDRISRLDEAVSLQLVSGGEPALMDRVADGSLGEAVAKWPNAAMDIARDTRSLDLGFKWRALAGDALLPTVVKYEIHRQASPDTFNRDMLRRILALDDRLAIERLASLDRNTLQRLLQLDNANLKSLARHIDTTGLKSLAHYLSALRPDAGRLLIETVAQNPAAMNVVKPESVQQAVLASRDQTAALRVMLRQEDLFDTLLFVHDVQAVKDGQISPRILIARYPYALIGIAGIGLVFLMMVFRVFFGRRPARRRGGQTTTTSV
ncbi:MAG: hypothetical protein ACK5JT_05665 [Hyphomicrobiaceae bacterium]